MGRISHARGGDRLVGQSERRRRPLTVACEILEGRSLLSAVAPGITALKHAAAHVVPHPKRAAHAPKHPGKTVMVLPTGGGSTLTAATQQFNNDLQAIATRDQLPPGAVSALQFDLAAVEFAETARPSAASLGKLQADYTAGLAAGSLNIPTLEADAQLVLASAGVPQGLIDQTGIDLNAVINSPNLTLADGQTIATDLQNILVAGGGGR